MSPEEQHREVSRIRTLHGKLMDRVDVTLLALSSDETTDSLSTKQFDLEKAKLYQQTFEVGKVNVATIVIRTRPPDATLENMALAALDDTDLRREDMSEAMTGLQKVNQISSHRF